MPLIIDTPPAAARRGRACTAVQIVAGLVGVATPLIGRGAWWTWLVVGLMVIVGVWVERLDIHQPWWPPSQWWKAAKHHP